LAILLDKKIPAAAISESPKVHEKAAAPHNRGTRPDWREGKTSGFFR
jgi:hypothetical protein